ncbi:hypothetical protein IIA28_18500, partial [candidate division KSB1 bacterium]|nr:hypothetical protein [candidate division KSB1 bacterium]
MKLTFFSTLFFLFLILLFSNCQQEQERLSIKEISNPAGESSAEPNLSVGDDGQVYLSWIEKKDDLATLKFSVRQGISWSSPQIVGQGENWFANWADIPSVQPIGGQFWVAHWLVKKAGSPYAYDAFVATSNNAGRQWSTPTRLHSDASATEHGFVSIYPNGRSAGAIWLDGRNMLNDGDSLEDHGMTLRSAAISTTGSISRERL